MSNMANGRIRITNLFLQSFAMTITFCTNIQHFVENGLTTNYSHRFLVTIPKNVPALTTVLDLSHNNISEILISDFRSLSKMQMLILSHNLIRALDFSIFQCNEVLEHLDLSHNSLQTISCPPVTSLRHLDLSYNNYSVIPLCPEFGTTMNLKYLGLSVKKIQKSNNFRLLAHLQLHTLFLDLEDLSEYGIGMLPVFNAKNLYIITPSNSDFHVLSDLRINATESLYLSNIQDRQINYLSAFLLNLNTNAALVNLTLHNIHCDWKDLINILQTVWKSTIEHFVISDGGQLEVPSTVHFDHTDTSLKSLTIKQTIFTTIRSVPTGIYRLFADMNITALTISDAGLIHMLCPSQYSHFKYLRFSNNSLTDNIFESCNNLALLESLSLQRNKFKNLIKVSLMTSHMKSLKYLDMSNNLLQYKDNTKCHWGEKLVKLNLTSNMLSESVFRCLPLSIQILDLQSNNILTIPKATMELRFLEEINLASNKLADLPGCLQFRSLRLLNIEMNSLASPSSEFYHSCQNIKELKAGHNPFRCSCELRQFINLEGQGLVKLVDWPGSYMCWYPEDLRGIQLEDFRVSDIICNTTLLITVIVIATVVIVAIVFFLCFYFHIPWYLKMIWQWTQVKHRNWKNQPEDHLNTLQFHAFVSYSEHDSDWVKNILIPNLKKEDESIRICQHERNFVAGKSIVENIIDCIEKSYKSIFVLSPNFVQSEWCHYELYFAHHKLFSEDVYGLILVLLEPIPTYIIPARYHKLKALMAKRTYLEWPKEKSKHGLFWANLRAAIQVKLPNNEEMEEL